MAHDGLADAVVAGQLDVIHPGRDARRRPGSRPKDRTCRSADAGRGQGRNRRRRGNRHLTAGAGAPAGAGRPGPGPGRIAGDGRSAALDQQVEPGRMVEARPVGMAVEVDPAGGDAAPGDVNLPRGRAFSLSVPAAVPLAVPAVQGDNSPVLDGDVGPQRPGRRCRRRRCRWSAAGRTRRPPVPPGSAPASRWPPRRRSGRPALTARAPRSGGPRPRDRGRCRGPGPSGSAACRRRRA